VRESWRTAQGDARLHTRLKVPGLAETKSVANDTQQLKRAF
jgi:hypothetical protein